MGFTSRDSGLYVGGDAKSLTTVDFNGDGLLDLVAGVNNDSLLAFEQLIHEQKNLSIQLLGGNGNTLAAGARIDVNFANGPRRSVEVAAGSGYLSQSASLVNIAVPGGGAKSLMSRCGGQMEHPRNTRSSTLTSTTKWN